jgi:hypothetical protein
MDYPLENRATGECCRSRKFVQLEIISSDYEAQS